MGAPAAFHLGWRRCRKQQATTGMATYTSRRRRRNKPIFTAQPKPAGRRTISFVAKFTFGQARSSQSRQFLDVDSSRSRMPPIAIYAPVATVAVSQCCLATMPRDFCRARRHQRKPMARMPRLLPTSSITANTAPAKRSVHATSLRCRIARRRGCQLGRHTMQEGDFITVPAFMRATLGPLADDARALHWHFVGLFLSLPALVPRIYMLRLISFRCAWKRREPPCSPQSASVI